ncbi:EAL domain-containing protein [Halomonas sp. DP8Y7-3]|uniref:EAL domain-containing protein n=1 Tax=Halomonas sp. DP8Y7-3 TaxID=2859079 RepID=UPI001C939D43|nr:EAL domain-containing protein [Halomonas sp. DP8Y7-3]MBY5928709.1 EAL domain-containing protein [Halomonas sp. DP8Y7-3]
MGPRSLSQAGGGGTVTRHPSVVAGLVLDRAPVGMALIDANDRLVWVNTALTVLACPTGGELIGRNLNELFRPFVNLLGERGSYHTLSPGEEWQQAWLLVDDSANARLGLMSCVSFDRDAGEADSLAEPLMWLVTFIDLNADAESVLERRHADIGSVASAWIFEDRLSHAFERADRLGQRLGVMLVELHGISRLMVEHGAEVASRVSRRAGRRLVNTLRREDSVVQLDRERWGILLEHPMSPETLQVIADRCLEALEPPFTLSGYSPALIEPRIGIALCPEDGEEAGELLAHAEKALEEAPLGSFAFYDGSLQQLMEIQQCFRQELQEALMFPDQQLYLVFQPQFDLSSRHCCGLEALVRWRHPRRGDIAPEEFLGLAAEMQLIDRLDRWVLKEVMAQRRRWREAGLVLGDWDVAVNIHPCLLDQVSFDGRALDLYLRQLCSADSGGDERLDWLSLEVDGTGLFEVGYRQSHLLRRLVALGIRLGVDRLGQSPVDLFGMASLPVSLGKLGPDTLRALAEPSSSARQSVAALIRCFETLEFTAVAVGVETASQLETVRALGLMRAQGHLLGAPLEAHALLAWVAAGARPAAPL